MLDRSGLLQRGRPKWSSVHVAALDAEVGIREMSGADRDEFEARCAAGRDSNDFRGLRGWLVQTCLCDDTGRRLFSDSEEDRDEVEGLGAAVIEEIFERVQSVNALNPTDEAQAEGN